MEKVAFLNKIEKNISDILGDYRFNNFQKQLIAKKLQAPFNQTYDEGYLWNKVLYISNNSCILISESKNEKLTTEALRISAQIYENFSEISERYDRGYCLILSALCYDLAGYSANAFCMLKNLKANLYSFKTMDEDIVVSVDNYILTHIQHILLKNIFKARNSIQENDLDVGLKLFNGAMQGWYSNVLDGENTDYILQMQKTYEYYLNSNNIPIAHLLLLLKTRFNKYIERSIWRNLNYNSDITNNPIWNKYIKLLTYDFYEENKIKDVNKRISRFELWISQQRAIERGILTDEKNYVIQMPTSTGKTFIAEIVILNHLIKHSGEKCIYVAPFRALTNEKEVELSKNLSKLGYSISSLSGSYEIDEFQDIMLKESDVLIATPEKIDLLLRINADFFNNVSLIVVDEGHIVGDISPRASLLEFLIIRLKIKIDSLRILFISAVMPQANADEYSVWLSGQKENVIRSLLYKDSPPSEEWEPTRKLIGKFQWAGQNGRIDFINTYTEDEKTREASGAFVPSIITAKQFGKKNLKKERFPLEKNGKYNKAETAALLGYKISASGNTLIFCSQPGHTRSIGRAFLKYFKFDDPKNIPKYLLDDSEKQSYYYSKIWFGDDSYITKCLKRGIGIHFGDMPEQVRNAVEEDFRNGKIRILISTNTVGQGINFPIKNLIFHSTLIGEGRKILNRDFWNIVGRAGRAGQETEGRIIFLINSYTDNSSFSEYINKENLNPAYSLFFKILRSRILGGVSKDVLENYLQILSEPYLFDLLTEEANSEEEIIEKIINNSLFKVQIEEKHLDLSILKQSFVKILKVLREKITPEQAKLYGKTGFSLKSNLAISSFIKSRQGDLKKIVESDNYSELLKLIFELFDIGDVIEVKIGKLAEHKHSTFFEIALLWIGGTSIEELRNRWLSINDNINKFYILISQGFYYRYAWGISSFLTIMINHLEIEMKDLPVNIKYLTSYIKYGLNNPNSCIARSAGIKSRDISNIFGQKQLEKTPKEFISWISNLNKEDLSETYSQYDIQNILNVAVRLSPKKSEDIRDVTFPVKGIYFSKKRKDGSLLIKNEDILDLAREYDNSFDPYAIKIIKDNFELGYVPRELSKRIATEIDIEKKQYKAIVKKVENKIQYNNIFCNILEI